MFHDAEGNLIQITNPDSTSREFVYDENHKLIMQSDERGNTTEYKYSQFGCIEEMTLPDGTKKSFVPEVTLALNGELGTSENPAPAPGSELLRGSYTDTTGGVTTGASDDLGNPLSITNQENETTTFERDEDGLITKMTDPRGVDYFMSYDDLGNMTEFDKMIWVLSEPTNMTKGLAS